MGGELHVKTTIHRFDLPPSEVEHEVITHAGAEFLPHVVRSDRVPGGFTLWATVPVPLGPVWTRHVRVIGTGDTADLAGWTHLGTYHDLGFVWHVFVVDGHRPGLLQDRQIERMGAKSWPYNPTQPQIKED